MTFHKYKIGKCVQQNRWSQTALDCYLRGCVCEGCLLSEIIESSKCHMKAAVIELVRIYGKPEYNEVVAPDGAVEYVLLNKIGKKDLLDSHELKSILDSLSNDAMFFIGQKIPNINDELKGMVGMLLDGASKDDVCRKFNVCRGSVNNRLGVVYKASKLSYKTKSHKLEELIEYFEKYKLEA